MQPMTDNQKLLYEIACDPDKSRNYFINRGVELYYNRARLMFYSMVGFLFGLLIGSFIG